MIDVNNLDMYGYLDHKYKGHNIRLVGKILEINEGDSTCKMEFDSNGEKVSEDGIPMEAVMLDEAVFDTLRDKLGQGVDKVKAGLDSIKKWATKAYSKIGGLVRTIINGVPAPCVNSVMIGQYAAMGALPDSVGVILSDQAKQIAEENNVKVSNKTYTSTDDPEELKQMNATLHAMIDDYKKTYGDDAKPELEGLKVSYLKVVNEKYGPKVTRSLLESDQIDNFFNPVKAINRMYSKGEIHQLYESGELQRMLDPDAVSLNESSHAHPQTVRTAARTGEYDRSRVGGGNVTTDEYSASDFASDDAPAAGLQSYKWENIPILHVRDIVNELMAQLQQAYRLGAFSEEMQMDDARQTVWMEHEVNSEDEFNAKSPEEQEEINNEINQRFKGEQKASSLEMTHPMLLWGAPGIGKTQIVNQCIAMFRAWQKGSKATLIPTDLAAMDRDSMFLPAYIERDGKKVGATMLPQTWLPVYRIEHGRNPEETKQLLQHADAVANANMSAEDYDKAENKADIPVDGGILFFDELMRADGGVMDAIMTLIDQRIFGEFKLGSHWVMVAASNRFYEMSPDHENHWEPAYGRRFQQVTFVPLLADWLKWAKGYDINPETGDYFEKQGTPRIDSTIIDFLSTSGRDAWYEIVDQAAKNGKTAPKEGQGARISATPAGWDQASKAMDRIAQRNRTMAIMHGDKHPQPSSNIVVDPATGEKELRYNMTNAQRYNAVKLNVGAGAEGTSAFNGYKSYMTFNHFFKDAQLKNIWKSGNIAGQKGGAILPPRYDPTEGRSSEGIQLLYMRLLQPGIMPIDPSKISTEEELQKWGQCMLNVFDYMCHYQAAVKAPVTICETEAQNLNKLFLNGTMASIDADTGAIKEETVDAAKLENIWTRVYAHTDNQNSPEFIKWIKSIKNELNPAIYKQAIANPGSFGMRFQPKYQHFVCKYIHCGEQAFIERQPSIKAFLIWFGQEISKDHPEYQGKYTPTPDGYADYIFATGKYVETVDGDKIDTSPEDDFANDNGQ